MHLPTDVVPLAVEPDGSDVLVARLRALGAAPVAPKVAASHLGAIDRQAGARSRRRRAAVAGLVAVSVLLGSTSLAAAGVLPAPAQTAMSSTLRRLGIEVPAPRRAAGTEGTPRRGAAPAGRAIAERAGNGGADHLHPDRAATRSRPAPRPSAPRPAGTAATAPGRSTAAGGDRAAVAPPPSNAGPAAVPSRPTPPDRPGDDVGTAPSGPPRPPSGSPSGGAPAGGAPAGGAPAGGAPTGGTSVGGATPGGATPGGAPAVPAAPAGASGASGASLPRARGLSSDPAAAS